MEISQDIFFLNQPINLLISLTSLTISFVKYSVRRLNNKKKFL